MGRAISYTLPGAPVRQMAWRGQDWKGLDNCGRKGQSSQGGGEGGVAEGPAHLSLQVTHRSWTDSTVGEGDGSWLFPGLFSCLGAPRNFFCPWDLSALWRDMGRGGEHSLLSISPPRRPPPSSSTALDVGITRPGGCQAEMRPPCR